MNVTEFSEALIQRQPVIVRRRVAWGECDPAGVVYTARFCDYALAARDWFLSCGLGVLDRPHPEREGINYPMRAMSFEFMTPLAADAVFDMTVTVARITERTFSARIVATPVAEDKADATTVFSALLTTVAVDSRSGRAVALPETVRQALEQYRQAQD